MHGSIIVRSVDLASFDGTPPCWTCFLFRRMTLFVRNPSLIWDSDLPFLTII